MIPQGIEQVFDEWSENSSFVIASKVMTIDNFKQAATKIIKMCYCAEARFKSGIDIGMFIRPQPSEVDRLKIELADCVIKDSYFMDVVIDELINKIKELENDESR